MSRLALLLAVLPLAARSPPAGSAPDAAGATSTALDATGAGPTRQCARSGADRARCTTRSWSIPRSRSRSNADAVRPPAQPDRGAVPPDGTRDARRGRRRDAARHPPPAGDCPQCARRGGALTLGALAASQAAAATAGCAARSRYSAAWATRLPADVPLYPDARVSRRPGRDADGCALRVVSFASAAPVQRTARLVLYARQRRRLSRPSTRPTAREHILAGTRGRRRRVSSSMSAAARRDGGTRRRPDRRRRRADAPAGAGWRGVTHRPRMR